jgi:hypothetical protein
MATMLRKVHNHRLGGFCSVCVSMAVTMSKRLMVRYGWKRTFSGGSVSVVLTVEPLAKTMRFPINALVCRLGLLQQQIGC